MFLFLICIFVYSNIYIRKVHLTPARQLTPKPFYSTPPPIQISHQPEVFVHPHDSYIANVVQPDTCSLLQSHSSPNVKSNVSQGQMNHQASCIDNANSTKLFHQDSLRSQSICEFPLYNATLYNTVHAVDILLQAHQAVFADNIKHFPLGNAKNAMHHHQEIPILNAPPVTQHASISSTNIALPLNPALNVVDGDIEGKFDVQHAIIPPTDIIHSNPYHDVVDGGIEGNFGVQHAISKPIDIIHRPNAVNSVVDSDIEVKFNVQHAIIPPTDIIPPSNPDHDDVNGGIEVNFGVQHAISKSLDIIHHPNAANNVFDSGLKGNSGFSGHFEQDAGFPLYHFDSPCFSILPMGLPDDVDVLLVLTWTLMFPFPMINNQNLLFADRRLTIMEELPSAKLGLLWQQQ